MTDARVTEAYLEALTAGPASRQITEAYLEVLIPIPVASGTLGVGAGLTSAVELATTGALGVGAGLSGSAVPAIAVTTGALAVGAGLSALAIGPPAVSGMLGSAASLRAAVPVTGMLPVSVVMLHQPLPPETGSLGVSVGLTASVPVTGMLGVIGRMYAQVAAALVTTGSLPGAGHLTAATTPVLVTTGTLGAGAQLAAAIGVTPSTTGLLAVGVPLTTALTPVFTASGPLPVGAHLTASVSGILATSGMLPVSVGLSGAADTPFVGMLSAVVGLTSFVAGPGSLWFPIPVGESGTYYIDFTRFGVSNDPFPMYGDNNARSAWFVFTASALETVTASFAANAPVFDYGMELYTGPVPTTPEDLTILTWATDASVSASLGIGQPLYMRVYPLSATEVGTGTLTWSEVARPASGTMEASCDPTITETPGWLRVSVAGATPFGTLNFYLDGAGTPFASGLTDGAGVFVQSGVGLPAIAVGSHSLAVTDPVTGQSVSLSFSVTLVSSTPSTLPSGTPTSVTPSVAPVIKWVFQNPATGGETYTLPINPSSMSNPLAGRNITSDFTLSPTGHAILWEGQPDPVLWSVEGSIETQAHLEAMERFYNLRSRFYVVDHLQRVWTVTFESFEAQIRPKSPNPWSHTYRAKFMIVGGPVSLV